MLARWKARCSRRLRDDAGSTMVTVLIIMLVLSIGGLAIAGLATNTTGSLLGTSDHAKAQAAVDAGVAERTAGLGHGDFKECSFGDKSWPADPSAAPISVASDPAYSYTFRCSSGVATLQVFAEVNGAKASREAVFSYDTVHEVPPPALVTKGSVANGLGLGRITAEDPVNHPADLWITEGNYQCAVAGGIQGSLYVPNGTVNMLGVCGVRGSIVTKNSINLNVAVSTGGDLISTEGGISGLGVVAVGGSIYADGDISIAAGSVIGGDVVSVNGKVTFLGAVSVGGSVYAKKDITSALLVYVGGDVVSETGKVTRLLSSAGGRIVSKSGEPTPGIPTPSVTPEWPTFTMADANALTSQGFTKVKMNGSCDWSRVPILRPTHPIEKQIEDSRSPIIIDATHCSGGLKLNFGELNLTNQLSIRSDVVILATGFEIKGAKFRSDAATHDHKLWFISPSDLPCSAARIGDTVGTPLLGAYMDPRLTPMLYTNCKTHFSLVNVGDIPLLGGLLRALLGDNHWNGAMITGDLGAGLLNGGLPNFTYRKTTLPGEEEKYCLYDNQQQKNDCLGAKVDNSWNLEASRELDDAGSR